MESFKNKICELIETYEKNRLPTTTHFEVLEKAVNFYGKESQVDKAIEEMSELSKALLKHRRAIKESKSHDYTRNYERTKHDIFEEIADVIIMLQQLIMIYSGKETVQEWVDHKVEQLSKHLNESEAEIKTDE